MTSTAHRAVYDAVTAREDHCCRVCGRGGDIHRHHIRGRAYTTTADVVCLCAECHEFTHVRVGGKRLKVSGNADALLTVHFRDGAGAWHEVTR